MKKKILIFTVVAIVTAFGIYKYAYKPQRDITSEKARVVTTSQSLLNDFVTNDSLANIKFLDKTIEIYGKITTLDLQTKSIIIDQKIYVTFLENIPSTISLNSNTTIKGRFIGFDDLAEEFRIDQASFKN
jgi:hypothetical protein